MLIPINREKYKAALRICMAATNTIPFGGALEPFIGQACADDDELYALCVCILAECLAEIREGR